jgi:hypothetical protein
MYRSNSNVGVGTSVSIPIGKNPRESAFAGLSFETVDIRVSCPDPGTDRRRSRVTPARSIPLLEM